MSKVRVNHFIKLKIKKLLKNYFLSHMKKKILKLVKIGGKCSLFWGPTTQFLTRDPTSMRRILLKYYYL